MGSQAIQGKLWGQRPKDWAEIQEQTTKAGYDYVLNSIPVTNGRNILDIGCGTGYFAKIASDKGLKVVGIDATTAFIELATTRVPQATFVVGEMEELPFEEKSFDYVSGFNSFQYAADTKNALTEARRILKNNGHLIAMIWGNKSECEAASYLKAVGSLLPPPPPGAPGPFALSENRSLENILEEIGFTIKNSSDIQSIWDYPNTEIALRGLMSAGPVARAIDQNGFDKVRETILDAIQPYIQSNGHVVYRNMFRVVISIPTAIVE
jgi:ubiquinone/menaquinone biosynthesis C-methylase UbiE